MASAGLENPNLPALGFKSVFSLRCFLEKEFRFGVIGPKKE